VYAEESPHLTDTVLTHLLNSQIPILGICYGLQELMQKLGGVVENVDMGREYGKTSVSPILSSGRCDLLFTDISENDITVWMSHGDKVTKLADGFVCIAKSKTSEFAAVKCGKHKIWGVQFHPEVSHTVSGTAMLKNFLLKGANLRQTWSIEKFVDAEIDRLRRKIGDRIVVGAVSGGVDSTVAAVLMHKAVGANFHPFLVDTGLMRKDEVTEVVERLAVCIPGMRLKTVDASKSFYKALSGVCDPEEKRRIIGRLFIQEFEALTAEIKASSTWKEKKHKFVLLQGTLYPDVIESVSLKGPSHTIKTHHNVGGLPDHMDFELVEPLRELFKDEVRQLGASLGLSRESLWRHPFPGPGLAIRIVGEVTEERVHILQEADAIFTSALRESGDYWKIGQAFAVLLPGAKSVGVMGDQRTYEMTLALRAVATNDYMTADWYWLDHNLLQRCSTRIVNEIKGINRVVYDVTSKPPGTIEWE